MKKPSNVLEAFEVLDSIFAEPTAKAMFAEIKEAEDMICFHTNLGRAMRNDWGLWQDSDLATVLRERGLSHADDMSHAILVSYWQYKHGYKCLIVPED